MNEQLRRNLLIAALVLLFVVVGGRRGLDWLRSGAAGTLGLVRGRTVDLDELRGIEVVDLRSADLVAGKGEVTPGRDPWRYGQRRAPRPPPPQEKPQRTAPPPSVAPLPAATEPAAPQPPPVDVTYIGSFGPARRKIAVFDDGDTVYNAVVGDVVKDRFQVVQIGFESVDLTFVGFPDVPPKRLPIGG